MEWFPCWNRAGRPWRNSVGRCSSWGINGQAVHRPKGLHSKLELRRIPDDKDGDGIGMEVFPGDVLDVGNRDAAIAVEQRVKVVRRIPVELQRHELHHDP